MQTNTEWRQLYTDVEQGDQGELLCKKVKVKAKINEYRV